MRTRYSAFSGLSEARPILCTPLSIRHTDSSSGMFVPLILARLREEAMTVPLYAKDSALPYNLNVSTFAVGEDLSHSLRPSSVLEIRIDCLECGIYLFCRKQTGKEHKYGSETVSIAIGNRQFAALHGDAFVPFSLGRSVGHVRAAKIRNAILPVLFFCHFLHLLSSIERFLLPMLPNNASSPRLDREYFQPEPLGSRSSTNKREYREPPVPWDYLQPRKRYMKPRFLEARPPTRPGCAIITKRAKRAINPPISASDYTVPGADYAILFRKENN